MKNIYYVTLDGTKDEYCNVSYVIAENVLEAEEKAKKYASSWDEGRLTERKALSVLFLAEERYGTGTYKPVLIL